MTKSASTFRCTLVTPLRNEMDNIDRLWATIQGQTRTPDEWIIADNGSSDGTREWLVQHSETSRFPVTVLSLPGKTIAQMLNMAIPLARHEIIACCHGGTRIPSDWLEHLLAPLQVDPDTDVSGGVWEPYGETPSECWVARSIYHDCELADARTYCPASRSIAFKRSAWEKSGGFPEWLPKFGEDTLYAIRLHAAGCKFQVAPKAIVGWRPKPLLWPLLRQYYFYGQANGCIRLHPEIGLGLLRPAVPLFGAAGLLLGGQHWLLSLVALAAIPVADHWQLRMRGKRPYKGFGHYLLWEWVLRLARIIGWLNGRWLISRGHVHRPPTDEAAVKSYAAKLNGSECQLAGKGISN